MILLELTCESVMALFHASCQDKYHKTDYNNFQHYKGIVYPRMAKKTFIPDDPRYNPYIDAYTLANALSVLANFPTSSRVYEGENKRDLNSKCLEYAKKAHIEILRSAEDLSFFSQKLNDNCWSKEKTILDDGIAYTGGMLSWERMENYLEDNFNTFTSFIERMLDISYYKSLCLADVTNKVRKCIGTKEHAEFISFLKNIKRTTLFNLYSMPLSSKIGVSLAPYKNNSKVVQRVRGNIHKYVHTFDAKIRVNVDNYFIQLLSNGPGDATILDGGLIYISDIKDYEKLPESNIYSGEFNYFFPKEYIANVLKRPKKKESNSSVQKELE